MTDHRGTAMRLFISAILAMGLVRFVLAVSGLPDSQVRYASMTAVILAGAIYFAIRSSSHVQRLKDAYLLILPYMVVEVAALGYTWATGRQTIFHAREYNMGTSIAKHTLGHLIGGLTWEPLFLFALMEVIHGVYIGARWLLQRRGGPA
jgi:hypothetical protein